MSTPIRPNRPVIFDERPTVDRGRVASLRRTPRWAWRAALVTILAMTTALLPARPSGAAGVVTHAWMAESAIDRVENADLRAILAAHPDHVRAGAMFPDAGYVVSGNWGEEAHWQRFIDNLTAVLLEQDHCGDLTRVDGPCAPFVAQLMGVLAHGIGDEVWDWLFEPNAADLDQYYMSDDFGPYNTQGGVEHVMDIVAIGHHGRPRPVIPPIAGLDMVIEAFERSGLSGLTEAHFQIEALGPLIWDVENSWSQVHLEPLMEAMPWMSANLIGAPGGVDFAAEAIAGAWDNQWGLILGDRPVTEVSARYPADGQRGIPATGWIRSYGAGSHPDRGGARTRIAASITWAVPYVPGSGGPAVGVALPDGSMTITERDTARVLPALGGFPRAVPYGAESGERMIAHQPGEDLQPCTWYRVDVTTALVDAGGRPVAPASWEFRTGADAVGSPCADDPASSRLAGLVVDETGDPVEGVAVLAYAEADGFTPTGAALTGADGRYSITDLPSGRYRAAFVPPADRDRPIWWSGGAISRWEASPVDHDGTTEWSTETLPPAGARMEGTVTDASGAPVADALVMIYRPDDVWLGRAWVRTRADGTYLLDRVAPEVYKVRVAPPPGAGLAAGWLGGPTRTGATEITLGSGSTTEVDLSLAPAP